MGRGPASFSIVPGGPPGPSIGLPDACPGPSRRGRVPFCRRDSTRPQNASASLPSSPHVRLSRAFLIREARGSARRAFGIGPPPASAGGPIRALSSSPDSASGEIPGNARPKENREGIRRRGRPGSPRSGDGGPPRGRGFRSLWPQAFTPGRRTGRGPPIPAPETEAFEGLHPCGRCRPPRGGSSSPRRGMPEPNGAPSLFRSPPPSCRPLAPLAGGVEGARAPSSGLPAPTALSVPGPSPGSRETPVEPGPAGRMFPDFTVREIAKTIPDLLRNPQKRPGQVEGNGVLRLSPGSRTWRGSFPRSRPEKFGRARSPPPVHTLSDTTNDTTDDTISDTTNGTARL
jgi:hypothetical protein